MKRPLIVGVMGGGHADEEHLQSAYRLGALIAGQGWILLNGGRNVGIMSASACGAAEHGGLTVGILPDDNPAQAGEYIRIPICTGMGSARNVINVLSSDIVVACQGGAGTVSEIALALKHGKPIITMGFDARAIADLSHSRGLLAAARTPEEVIAMIKDRIANLTASLPSEDHRES
ncbi:MAG: TIGR00725 family protein [Desulfobacteraceae bacterium]|nr:MAG: TIGR00725 family protein [Desulfobacteraceae bacterium]